MPLVPSNRSPAPLLAAVARAPRLAFGLLAALIVCSGCRLRRTDAAPEPAASSSSSSAPAPAPAASLSAALVSGGPSGSASSAAEPPGAGSDLSSASDAGDAGDAAVAMVPDDLPRGSVVIAFAGAGSDPALSDHVLRAVRSAGGRLARGGDPLDAATGAVVVLEDDPLLNAGTGSAVRIDGTTAHMDALAMDGRGRLGAVAAVDRVRNPVLVARAVAHTPYSLLVGPGGVGFARSHGFGAYDPITTGAQKRRDEELARLAGRVTGSGEAGVTADSGLPSDAAAGESGSPAAEASAGDASRSAGRDAADGAVAARHVFAEGVAVLVRSSDGQFAVAASGGGRAASLPGQVGAIPLVGAAVFVGEEGAVAATGPSELLVNQLLARAIYERLLRTRSARDAVTWGLAQLPAGEFAGAAVIDRRGHHIAARGPMAWASWTPVGERVARPEQEAER